MAVRPDSTTQTDSELEQYGVWVKAEPHDIAEEPSTKDVGASEFDLPSDTPALPEDSFLTEDEKKIIGSFDEIEAGSETKPEGGEAKAPSDLEDLPPLEDFETSLSDSVISPNAELDMDKIQGLDSSADALQESSVPDSGAEQEAAPSQQDAMAPESPAAGPEPKAQAASVSGQGPGELEDVSAEFLDVLDDKEEPREAKPEPAAPAEEEFSLPKIDDFAAEAAEEPKAEEKPAADAGLEPPLDIDLSFDDSLDQPKQKAGAKAESSDSGFEEVSEFDDFLKEENDKEPRPEEKQKAEAVQPDAGFDDIAALTEDLSAPAPEAAAPETAGAPAKAEAAVQTEIPSGSASAASGAKQETPGLSNELLLQIANELSSIRGELVNLKGELATIKQEEKAGAAPASGGKAEAGKKDSDKNKADKRGGFFDEEEDETIALTGDELDNILNTADFTEEAAPENDEGLSPGAGPAEDKAAAEPEIGAEGILPESGDYGAPESAEAPAEKAAAGKAGQTAEKPAAAKAAETPAAESAEIPGFEEISSIAEAVEPMTAPPEDTSYLEVPLEDSDADSRGLDLGDTPIHEEPLVEPDLSGFKLDEDAGPAEEIEEELPVIDGPAENESSPASMADMTLGMKAAPGYMPESAAEPLAAEPIPEIEPSSFEELELPGESKLPAEEAEELNPIEEQKTEAEPEVEAMDLGGESRETGLPPDIDSVDIPDMIPPAEETPTAIEEPLIVESADEAPIDISPAEEVEDVKPEAAPAEPAPAAVPAPKASEPRAAAPKTAAPAPAAKGESPEDEKLKGEIRGVLSYLDKLLESLPEDKIEEFAKSEYFDTYKKLFEELGLV